MSVSQRLRVPERLAAAKELPEDQRDAVAREVVADIVNDWRKDGRTQWDRVEVARLNMLRKHQWSDYGHCPECHAHQPDGHQAGCALASLL